MIGAYYSLTFPHSSRLGDTLSALLLRPART
jgi:hypothetical protein